MKTILLIDDDVKIQDAVITEGAKLGITVIPYVPKSKKWDEMRTQLSELCKSEQFDFALLDFFLWDGFKGSYFAKTLHNNKVAFIAFSSSDEYNSKLLSVGAIDTIQKHYISNEFDRRSFSDGFQKFFNKKLNH